jgi:hypothetical protein
MVMARTTRHGHHGPVEPARIALGGDAAAGAAGDPVDRDRLLHRRADAVRHRLERPPRTAPFFLGAIDLAAATTPSRRSAPSCGTARWHSPCMASSRRRSGSPSPASPWPRSSTCCARQLPGKAARLLAWPKRVLENKYGLRPPVGRRVRRRRLRLGRACARSTAGDRRDRGRRQRRLVDFIAGVVRRSQTGLPVPLRLRHDPRPDRAAGRADPVLGMTARRHQR